MALKDNSNPIIVDLNENASEMFVNQKIEVLIPSGSRES